jgi:hypothetical protein
MSRLSDAMSRGLSHHRSAQGSPVFTFGDVADIPCVISTLKRGTVLEVGGFAAEIAFTLIVRQADIETPPVAGKTVVFNATTYRVLNAASTAGGSSYEFDLGNPRR